ncbi:MAG: four helix bundle protein [Candidatus Cloacimonadota bacterium]|nr:MAG: four helix bundle protein [Candidatus Cloacimonadota bacterium]
MKIRHFKDLIVWQLSSQLSKEIFQLTKTFPKSEKYALTSDIIRAARSIPSNIAEGFGRYHFSEQIQFYNISKGSLLEVQNHLEEAKNIDYISEDVKLNYYKRYHVVEVKLNKLIASTARARKQYKNETKKKKSDK